MKAAEGKDMLHHRTNSLRYRLPVHSWRQMAPTDSDTGVGFIIRHTHRPQHMARCIAARRTGRAV